MELGVLLRSIRVKQWVKNLFLFAALVFSRNLLNLKLFVNSALGFICFSFAASSIYLLNDLLDYESDVKHPVKCKRPIASGELSKKHAAIGACCLAGTSLLGALFLNSSFALVILIYLLTNVAYSIKLKHMVIIDVMVIAFGFVLRVISGGLIIHVSISLWLIVCTTLLSLFLALSKRRHELVLLDNKAGGHRKILDEYNPYLLDQMISVVTASTLVAYLLYTMDPVTIEKFNSPYIVLTFPFVLYGIFRYLYLVHQKARGGNPTKVLLTDTPLIVNSILWVVSFEVIVLLSPIVVSH